MQSSKLSASPDLACQVTLSAAPTILFERSAPRMPASRRRREASDRPALLDALTRATTSLMFSVRSLTSPTACVRSGETSVVGGRPPARRGHLLAGPRCPIGPWCWNNDRFSGSSHELVQQPVGLG